MRIDLELNPIACEAHGMCAGCLSETANPSP